MLATKYLDNIKLTILYYESIESFKFSCFDDYIANNQAI